MKLLTKEIRDRLKRNWKENQKHRLDVYHQGDTIDHRPVVKFFDPAGAGTWLFTELNAANGDTLFGLCDLGFGTPELGSVSLAEITGFRGRFGLGIERDKHFTADKTLSEYADKARKSGGIAA